MKRSKLLVTLLAIFVICLTFSIALIAFADESEIGDVFSNGRVTQEVTENNDLKITLKTDTDYSSTRAYYKQPITLDMANNKWFEMNFTVDEFNVDGGLRISFLASAEDFPMDSYGDGFGVYFWDETAWGYPELQAFRCDFYKYSRTAGSSGLIDAKAVRSDAYKITGQSFHLKVWEYDADNIAIQVDRDDNGTNIQAIGAFAKSNLPEGFDIKNCTLMITPDIDINRAHSYEKDIVLTIKDINGKKPVDQAEQPATSIINESEYDVSYVLDSSNAKTWTNGNIGNASVKYFFKAEDDGVKVAIRALGVSAGELMQLNFNPGNKLAGSTGQFLSFVTGDSFKLLQHNHKNGVLDDANPNGADISDKVDGQIAAIDGGYEIVAKLPKALFTITDVDGADSFVYGQDDIYFGMFIVTGGHGYTNQSTAPGTDWTVDGLGLTEYVFKGQKAPETQPATQPDTQPETQPQTGDATVAMFAVIVVLTLGAVIVFAKKRSF
jgi:LPXTG-motif cell wall-anchored protein